MLHRESNSNGRPQIDLRGEQGNAYCILGIAKQYANQLKECDPKYDWGVIQKKMMSSDYNNLVHVFEEYFGDYIDIYGAEVLDNEGGEL